MEVSSERSLPAAARGAATAPLVLIKLRAHLTHDALGRDAGSSGDPLSGRTSCLPIANELDTPGISKLQDGLGFGTGGGRGLALLGVDERGRHGLGSDHGSVDRGWL